MEAAVSFSFVLKSGVKGEGIMHSDFLWPEHKAVCMFQKKNDIYFILRGKFDSFRLILCVIWNRYFNIKIA